MKRGPLIGSFLLVLVVLGVFGVLALWKYFNIQSAIAASMNQPEHVEAITVATAQPRPHRNSATAIGTVLALRSITLRNELAGTVRQVNLTPGQIVEAGTLLVALDVSVEEAELKAQQAQAALAETMLKRVEKAGANNAVSQSEIDRARAELEVAKAQIARLEAIIERKMIYAPFRAVIGLSDVHIGQYLGEGTELTTLQGVENPPSVHVDFSAAQHIAAGLNVGDEVEVMMTGRATPMKARIIAIDARINEQTRNAMIRALLHVDHADSQRPSPGASVRVGVPAGPAFEAVAIPVNGLRKGPGGDFAFVIEPDEQGQLRATMRRVRSGAMVGDEVLIFEGIKPGEQVAASGSFKLRDGLLVAIANGGSTPANRAH